MQRAFLSSRLCFSDWLRGTRTLRPSVVTVDQSGSDEKATDQRHGAQRGQAASASSMPLGQAS